MPHDLVPASVIRAAITACSTPLMGVYGLPHWGRVLNNGLALCSRTGANERVVAAFAVLHDARRLHEGMDPGHAKRAADLARTLQAELGLTHEEFHTLHLACERHSDGQSASDETINVCWDADLLDGARLGRSGLPRFSFVNPRKLDGLIGRAEKNARRDVVPGFVVESWLPLVPR